MKEVKSVLGEIGANRVSELEGDQIANFIKATEDLV